MLHEMEKLDRRTRAARADGREARNDLLDAALRVFAGRGYREARVDDICAEAGCSKGALYWHFSGKEELLSALLDERVDKPMRERFALLASAPVERDMAELASQTFAEQLENEREVQLLDREYWSLALRDPELRARYVERQAELRRELAASLVARAQHLGTPELGMSGEEVARVTMSIIGGLAGDELIEPNSVRPELLGEALATIYAGLVARAASAPKT
jgi:AcrR family transcriptional regulator